MRSFDSKKRGKLLFLVMVVPALFVLSAFMVFAGYCMNPLSSDYCQDVAEDVCCSGGCPSGQYPAAEPTECQNPGCCFSDSSIIQVCVPGAAYEGQCNAESGMFAADCSQLSECDYGCCCWFDNTNQSDLKFNGSCDTLQDSVFNIAITDTAGCSDFCNTSSGTVTPGAKPECNDSIDNDNDGLTDYPEDTGCTSAADDSETDPNVQCDDGLDNDNDGNIDSQDTSCAQYPNKNENFMDLDVCTTSGQISSQVTECRCRDSYVCSGRQYCCNYGCYNSPCGSETCYTGSRRSCGTWDGNGCELFNFCYDGSWGTDCIPDPSCGVPYEICNDGIDNNGDGNIDCDDVVCHGLECSPSEASCQTKGYKDPYNHIYKCCYTGNVNDCMGNDGIADTCGSCSCLAAKPDPYMKSVTKQPGSSNISVKWGLNCDVDLYLYKCTKGATECDSYSYFGRITSAVQTRELIDEDIEPNNEYCYYVQAEYPGSDIKNSDIMCVGSGDEACMEFSTNEVCLNSTLGTDGKRVYRAVCDSGNNLETIENCEESHGSGYICMGPYQAGNTECVYQSDCDECGRPLNMFADYMTSRATYADPQTGYEYDMDCRDIPTCYYDYSDTTIDVFNECSDIFNCYGYRSKKACEEEQSSISNSNNKCLARDCGWQPISGDIDRGICFENLPEYRSCNYCNEAENNKIFDDCNFDRCRLFGNCFLKPDGVCSDAKDIVCSHYTKEEYCTNGVPVVINTAYDANGDRYTGDNSVTTPSGDVVGLGLCRWDSSRVPNCFKDADGDTRMDADQRDMTPPFSRVMTSRKVRAINFTLSMSDPNPDGSLGTGIMYTYICLNDTARCYPTERYVPAGNIVSVDFGSSHGLHHVYYYSEDIANNLEVVKSFDVEVDRSPPSIDIAAFVQNDVVNYVDSSVIFSITLDENATCTDDFEGASPKIYNQRGSRWVVKYAGLTDGFYQYKVTCTDLVGNTAEEFYDLRIDADGAVYDPKPQGKLDYTPVTLGISTIQDATCRWGPVDNDFSRLPNTFAKQDMGSYYYYFADYGLASSGTYSFDVKCNVQGRISDDEIQFVYDVAPPTTKVLDMFGNDFNFSNWYTGVGGKIFLQCVDEPENGFGCNSTYYCVDNAECTPNTPNDPMDPIEYNLADDTHLVLCYYSKENSIATLGGRQEQKVCNAIQIDHDDPVLTIDAIGNYNAPDNPYTIFDHGITISGSVIDPDASSAPSNHVTIKVSNQNGSMQEYTGIASDIQFSQAVSLSMGLNTITVVATDRSGATDIKTVYVMVAEYTGQKIVLLKPNKFGVSATRVFDLQVQTYTDSDCRFSINDASFAASEPMTEAVEPAGQGYNYYYTKSNFQLGSVSEVTEPVYIKCKDSYGVLFTDVFNLSWDDSKPVIEDVYLDNSDGKKPPTMIEFPLETNIIVETDDQVRCRFSDTRQTFTQMPKFDGYDNQSLASSNRQFIDDLENPSTNIYYLQCENGAGLISDKYKLTFKVDTSIATGFTFVQPPKKSANSTFVFKLHTTKSTSECLYGPTQNPANVMTAVDSKTHLSSPITLSEGKYTYYFKCTTFDQVISDSYTFTIDTSPPSIPVIDDGNYSWYLVKLSAKWNAQDNLSKIRRYNYSIGTSPGAADVHGWTETTKNKITVSGLSLTNGSTYYWSVKAMNELGLWSEIGNSDGVTIDTSSAHTWTNSTQPGNNDTQPTQPSPCYNGIKDDNETDIDCGGVCGPCGDNKNCNNGSDCISKVCTGNKCIPAACDDNVMNQDESDIDCGGLCAACSLGKGCNNNADCESGFCNSEGKCDESECGDGSCESNETCSSCPDDCGDCTSDGCMVDGKPDTDCDRMPDWWESQYNLDVHNDDADEDPDEDGYTNYDEFIQGTDPTVPDNLKKTGFWTWLLLIIAGIIILGGGSYVGYEEYMKKKAPPAAMRTRPLPGSRMSMGRTRPIQPRAKTPQEKYLDSLSSMIRKKRKKMKSQERSEILSAFDDAGKPGQKIPLKTSQKPSKSQQAKAGQKPASAMPAAEKPSAKKAAAKPIPTKGGTGQQPGSKPAVVQSPGVKKASALDKKPMKNKGAATKRKSAAVGLTKDENALKGLYEVAKAKKGGEVLKDLSNIANKSNRSYKKSGTAQSPKKKNTKKVKK